MKMDAVERERGRMGPNAIRAIKSYIKRDSTSLSPCDVFISDGHCFDAEVAHPHSGLPVRPEVTPIVDVFTRKCVGWSIALAESTWAVADALRMATVTHGVPAIYYADRGSGQLNTVLNDPTTGMLARIGIRREKSIARNSQARGVIEAFHKNLINMAKKLPTYIGRDMDKDASDRVHKLTRADIKAAGSSPRLMTWEAFYQFVAEGIAEYNARPHSALPKLRDPQTGRTRHQSPNEAWDTAVAGGWEPVTVDQDTAEDLFRPYTVCRANRGLIRFSRNRYHSRDLDAYRREQVMVGYDIHDPSRVWVRDMEGRFITEAKLNGHVQPYFPDQVITAAQSVREQKAAERARGKIARIDRKMAAALAELHGSPLVLEHQPTVTLSLDQQRDHEALVAAWTPPAELPARRVAAAAPAATPLTDEDQWFARARGLEARRAAGEVLSEEDGDWLANAVTKHWYVARAETERLRAAFNAAMDRRDADLE